MKLPIIRSFLWENINAKAFVLKKAKYSNIIIINENHHIPRNKAFVTSLLDSLAKLGFKYLALESITNHYQDENAFLLDSALISRGIL